MIHDCDTLSIWICSRMDVNIYFINFQKQIPYFVKLRVTNCAGLFVIVQTPPVLFDETLPLAGQVKDGVDFESDLLWFNDTTKIEGVHSVNLNFAS